MSCLSSPGATAVARLPGLNDPNRLPLQCVENIHVVVWFRVRDPMIQASGDGLDF